ncbi:hypothetical protein N7505_002186 [Penicillium chrysogenum]|uniref:VCBS repeat-containing protein n=1 Tax=Penicillium chrysogenum TaxID=5076 RepID=A0ABQ8X1W1_PENCH|nr:hypothetical protein N7505_002186 [Penicillium chrysogenum]
MTEKTNSKEQRQILENEGWSVVYGDLINEWDIITGVASIPFGLTGVWFSQQVQAQLQKFQQSLGDVSDYIVNQARDYLKDLLQQKKLGEGSFNGLGVRVGILTIKRRLEFLGGPLPSLPPPPGGVEEIPSLGFERVYPQDGLGNGIGGYDLKSSADQAFAFDYDHSGKLDHLALYRPATGTIWILKNSDGVFQHVYQQGDPGNGIGGYDLKSSADRVFAFDYDHSGKLDHLVLYRPGTGTIWILKNSDGVFQHVYQQGDPGNGIGGYDLKSSADRVFAFDYDHSGKLDHLALYRPATGTIWILKNSDGVFRHVYQQGDPGNGIGGYDLKSSADQAFAFDYDHSGKLDHLALYRPATGIVRMLRRY